jgi:hypothetical protein
VSRIVSEEQEIYAVHDFVGGEDVAAIGDGRGGGRVTRIVAYGEHGDNAKKAAIEIQVDGKLSERFILPPGWVIKYKRD